MQPFSNGKFLQETFIDVLKCYGKEGENMSEKVRDIPLSSQTITDRTKKISNYLRTELKNWIENPNIFLWH